MKSAALEQVKSNLQREAVIIDRIDAKGRLAYRMGIERRNNPENLPTIRVLWERGWDAAKTEFEAMQQRWK